MSDMRLIVAGAGGRMGRTLVKAIAETPGLRSPARPKARARRCSARTPACSPACRRTACTVTSELRRCTLAADGDHRFHRAGRDRAARRARGRDQARAHHRHHRHVGARTRRRSREAAKHDRDHEVRQHEPRRQSARRADEDRSRRRSARNSTSKSSRCITTRRSMRRPAPRCCSAGPPPQGRKIDLEGRIPCAGATATPARARPAISALRRCAAARVVGEHSVIFAGPAERIELAHKAEDRMIFARGALQGRAVGARQASPGFIRCRRAWAEGSERCR